MGWHWALEIARLGHEVWVLTRANNRGPIEAALIRMPAIPNLHFLYYDLPSWARWWKKGARGLYPYYIFWQWGACRLAKREHARTGFEYVHHITFGSIRLPSFMGVLGVPFVFGPVGGGERAPWRLRRGYPLRGWVNDAVRDLGNILISWDPLMRHTLSTASLVLTKTPDSRALIPQTLQRNVRDQLEVGVCVPYPHRAKPGPTSPRMLYVGRFIYFKGMHLGLSAFARCRQAGLNATLTMVGAGPDEGRWRRQAADLGLQGSVRWLPWQDSDALQQIYPAHDLFLFPSLHDSSGNAILEAMAHGLPVVCLDLGGPAVLVNDNCGRAVPARGLSSSQVVAQLAGALIELSVNPSTYVCCSKYALVRAHSFNWAAPVSSVYDDLSKAIL